MLGEWGGGTRRKRGFKYYAGDIPTCQFILFVMEDERDGRQQELLGGTVMSFYVSCLITDFSQCVEN